MFLRLFCRAPEMCMNRSCIRLNSVCDPNIKKAEHRCSAFIIQGYFYFKNVCMIAGDVNQMGVPVARQVDLSRQFVQGSHVGRSRVRHINNTGRAGVSASAYNGGGSSRTLFKRNIASRSGNADMRGRLTPDISDP